MKNGRQSGASLIEMLVVIVVFLVGILAFVQIFPVGLGVLRTTRNNTTAANLANAEMQRLIGQDGQLPDMIVPVSYTWSPGATVITINPNRQTQNLMPDLGGATTEIDGSGNLVVDSNSLGNWQLLSGSNLFNRVIGEGQPVPGPRRLAGMGPGLDFGSLVNLKFAPIYDDATAGVLTVYGNDLIRRWGNRRRGFPNNRARSWEFYYVDNTDTDGENFPGEDQLWVGPFEYREFRITFTFDYDDGGGNVGQYEVVIPVVLDPAAPPAFARQATENGSPEDLWVISLPQLVTQPDIYGNASPYTTAGWRGAEPWSCRMQRIYRRIGPLVNFSNDPYEFKVISPNSGQLLVNPAAATSTVPDAFGGRSALRVNADYTVFDWRILRDEFRVPLDGALSRKLLIQGIQSASSDGPDGLPYGGLIIPTPDVSGTVGSQDFTLIDTDTGAVILGNENNNPSAPGYPQFPNSAYEVNKIAGTIEFRDVTPGTPGLSAYLSYPTGIPGNPWTAPVLVDDISGRNVRALYRGLQNWAVQPFKAAARYRVVYGFGANGLAPGECFVGSTNGLGQNDRLYFPPSDVGQKVVVGELWINNGSGLQAVRGQDFQIEGIEPGINLAFASLDQIDTGAVFDFTQGYAVRNVQGASLKVRVLWNPAFFSVVGGTGAQNFERLEEWMRSYRRVETQSFATKGANR
ncbi:MAG: hypothetical protein KF812_06430 [Fimbriimonadaceae bacterium]|nr:hypothetical protein [Fimbriimonadaceae bacterium]